MSIAGTASRLRDEDARGIRRLLPHVLLAAVTLLAGVLDFWSLTRNGTGNDFYAAAVRSMLQSWSNFFFASFDPTGFVTVDKPPVAFWIEAASAKLFGFSSLSLLAPSAIAGAASVAVLGRSVTRVWGNAAGTVAALALALTPVALVVNRSNNPDAILVLSLVLAAWAGIRALESGRLRWVVLAAVFLGLGFNVKMLAAYLVLPALGLAYLLCAPRTWRIRFAHLGVAGAVAVALTFAWLLAVDLTPASQRPYVDNSQNNSAVGLAFGYNGVQRVLGGVFGRERGGGGAAAGSSNPGSVQGRASGTGVAYVPGGGGYLPGGGGRAGYLPGGGVRGGYVPGGGAPGGRAGGGGIGGGAAFGGPTGFTRLLSGDLAGQGSWLLPLAVVGAISALLAVGLRRRSLALGSLVLFGGWVAVVFVVFSYSSGIFHPYYISELAPGVAALVGIAVVSLWRDVISRNWRVLLPVVGLLGTAVFQLTILSSYPDQLRGWGVAAIAITAAAAIGVVAWALLSRVRLSLAPSVPLVATGGLALGLAALLVAPTAWTQMSLNSTQTGAIIQAGPAQGGAGFGGRRGGGDAQAGTGPLLSFLQKNASGTKYLLVTTSSMSAAPYIIGSGQNVISIGGFSGQDRIITQSQLAGLVAKGEMRYFLLQGAPTQAGADRAPGGGGFGGGGFGASSATGQVANVCTVVPASQWQGTTAAPTGGRGAGAQLYDCAGKGAALAKAAAS